MIAPRVGITEPTVAPFPRCTSGMIATCPATIGSDAMFLTCATASYSTSTPFVQARTLFNALRSMMFSI